MTERNPYSQQFNYDTYDQPARRGANPTFRERVTARLTNPVFATGALLLTAAAFAGIILASYPDSTDDSNVPVIQADGGDMYGQPPENGGLEMPQQNSTVFNNIHATGLQEQAPVEDLLADEKPIDKLEAFAKEAESMFDEDKAVAASAGETADEEAPPAEITENVQESIPPAANDNKAPSPIKTIKITQTVEKISPQQLAAEAGAAKAAATGAAVASFSEAGQIRQPAGSAPETLAFVKSVLNEKDGKGAAKAPPPTQAINTQDAATQPTLQEIEPAAGAADASAKSVVSGSYYVQLASVTSESGVPKEWNVLQKKFASLAGAQYRVQKADLGERGTRYRIQAGPMNKDLATSVCDSIKAQKPGGCIIVQ